MALEKIIRPFSINNLSSYIIYSDFACLKELVDEGSIVHELRIKDKHCSKCKGNGKDNNENIGNAFFSIEVGIRILKEIEELEQLRLDIENWKHYPETIDKYFKYFNAIRRVGFARREFLCKINSNKEYIREVCDEIILKYKETFGMAILSKRTKELISQIAAKYKHLGFSIKDWYKVYKKDRDYFAKEIASYYRDKSNEIHARRRDNHIKKIKVKGLFGYHSYTLDLENKEYAVIIGTNGLGKTTIFNILEALLVDGNSILERHNKIIQLYEIPFDEVKVEFKNGVEINVGKNTDCCDVTINIVAKGDNFSWKIDKGFTDYKEKINLFSKCNKDIIEVCENLESFSDENIAEYQYIEKLSEYFYNINRLFPSMNNEEMFSPRFQFIRTRRDDINKREEIYTKWYKNQIQKMEDKYFWYFQKDFERFYYDNDPSKKTFIYDNDKLVALTSRKIIDDKGNIIKVLSFDEEYMLKEGENIVEGVKIPLNKLSSGELNILAILFDLYFRCLHDAIILIDEPEISLHIAWQQQLGERLSKVISNKEKRRAQIIVATHSPFIASANNESIVEAKLL